MKQLNRIIVENFPKNSTSFDDTSRLGRSHSDATIISSSSITTLNGRRLFRPDQLVIPEGVPVDENFPSTPSENELDDRIKQLAVTIAAGLFILSLVPKLITIYISLTDGFKRIRITRF